MAQCSETVPLSRCRICTFSKPNQASLFRRNLSLKVMKLGDIKIFEGDGLPSTICLDCESSVDQCFRFREQIQWADKKFRLALDQIEVEECNIKQEVGLLERYLEEGKHHSSSSSDNDNSEVPEEVYTENTSNHSLPAQSSSAGPSSQDDHMIQDNLLTQSERVEEEDPVPNPLAHVHIIEDTNKVQDVEMADDPLGQQEPMIETIRKEEQVDPAVDPLICMKEETVAMESQTENSNVLVEPSTSTSVARSVILNSINILTSIPNSDKEVQNKSRPLDETGLVVLKEKSFSTFLKFEVDKNVTSDTFSDDKNIIRITKSRTSLYHPYSLSPPHFIVNQETSALPKNQAVISSNKNCDTSIGTTTLEYKINSEKELFCLTCNIQFNSLEQFQEHRSKEGYFCRICTSVFMRHHELEFHFFNHKTDKCDYFCLPCNIHFNSVEQLQEHKKLQNPLLLSCRACAVDSTIKTIVAFNDHLTLDNHFFTHQIHKCICGEVFFIKRDLICHRNGTTRLLLGAMHTIETFSCYICDTTFENKCKLQSHREFHFDNSGNPNDIYETIKRDVQKPMKIEKFRVKTQSSCKVHGKQYSNQQCIKEGFTCIVCKMFFKVKSCYYHHMISAHSPYENMECTSCKKMYLGPVRLNRHIKRDCKGSDSLKGETYFTCPICSNRFRNKSKLVRHELRHEALMEHCNICETFFKGISRTRAHIREEHPETTIFRCKYCTRHFKENSLLNSHIRIDHPSLIKKYKQPYSKLPKNQCCDSCGERFLTRQELRRHQRIHLNLKPFKCEICGVAMETKATLKKHIFFTH